jgi:hypothetical protein
MMGTFVKRSAFIWRLVWNFLVGILLLPFALMGLIINAIPLLLLWLIGRIKMDPAVAATVKPGASIVLFLIAWGVAGWSGWTVSGVEGIAAVLLIMPFYMYALFAIYERGTLGWRAWRGWWRSRHTDVYQGMVEDRRAVVEAVVAAI